MMYGTIVCLIFGLIHMRENQTNLTRFFFVLIKREDVLIFAELLWMFFFVL